MKTSLLPLFLIASLFVVDAAQAAEAAPLTKMEWKIGDDTRVAFVYFPPTAKEKPAPVVFAFHGHGGSGKWLAEHWAYQVLWPEAICVYMQGLPTPGGKKGDPDGEKPGWQIKAGGQDDRDLKFFDEVLATLRKDDKVDDARIYATGHSNGGFFTYLLWAVRGDVFAAVAPSGSTATTLIADLKPKPCLHVAGEKDPLVKIAGQRETMEAVRKLNGCDPEGQPDGHGLTVYASRTGTPFVAYIYDGDHTIAPDAPEKITAFFKQQVKK